MAILYALISRGKVVLAEYTWTSGNFPTITRVLLAKIPSSDAKMSYVYDQYVFHYVVEDGITYLCMAEESDRRRLPFTFLDEIKNRFLAQYGQRIHTAIAFAMNEDFGRVIQKQMDLFNQPDADQFASLHKQLDDVRNVMVQNIEMVLERGEKLELLVDKTDQLQNQAFVFARSAKKLKYAMFWKKVKIYSLIASVTILILLILFAVACNPNGSKCKV
uniref:V-SNARE coiled-coil homology domain-containing protein n=1 Tax=Fibrocapsa japonica TaxID=94617 RepID=A0A7S2UV86_9STRA|mmetsp:Transcript_15004/g.22149  ORF Transcript_15004/g.22149 Transcript_15004/m.22149 type:complete len:218 (+) Transcript_15004:156-809(+)|eukprot:CAMPEP_0113943388 /NCGR_PEP_ID=MMETSP1339-20121228/23227_1 /TAXON_ID=94617 /ORGANISM="Fibrocapsa japonica" /LENGTH=217 /DNA_ID=CAMNT_0000948245 /DNA_START=149 /DNA_END=802 /DNA_ORIENTATION=+ /assembly_acc=CAM_ASM_000762